MYEQSITEVEPDGINFVQNVFPLLTRKVKYVSEKIISLKSAVKSLTFIIVKKGNRKRQTERIFQAIRHRFSEVMFIVIL